MRLFSSEIAGIVKCVGKPEVYQQHHLSFVISDRHKARGLIMDNLWHEEDIDVALKVTV